MKNLFTFFFIGIALLNSCSNEPDDKSWNNNKEFTISIPVSDKMVSFETVDSAKVRYTAIGDWRIIATDADGNQVELPDWVTVIPSSGGDGEGTVTVYKKKRLYTPSSRTIYFVFVPKVKARPEDRSNEQMIEVVQNPQKRITSILMTEQNENGEEITPLDFLYDDDLFNDYGDNRVVAISADTEITYGDNKVKFEIFADWYLPGEDGEDDALPGDGRTNSMEYPLSSGRVTSLNGHSVEVWRGEQHTEDYSCRFAYTGGRLAYIDNMAMDNFPLISQFTYSWRYANLERILAYGLPPESRTFSITAVYDDRYTAANGMNLNLWHMISGTVMFLPDTFPGIMGLCGVRSKELPSEISCTTYAEASHSQKSITIRYTTDDDGYITRIDMECDATSYDLSHSISTTTIDINYNYAWETEE